MSQPHSTMPMDPAGWCAPHLASGVYEHATTWVAGTAMCTPHAVANLTAAASSSTSPSTGGGLVIRLS